MEPQDVAITGSVIVIAIATACFCYYLYKISTLATSQTTIQQNSFRY